PELEESFVEHHQPSADVTRAAAVQKERACGRIEIPGRDAVALAVEKLHGDERVEEISGAAQVETKFLPKFRSSHAAAAERRKDAKIDGSEQHLRRPKGKCRL